MNQKIYFGFNSINYLKDVLAHHSPSKVLLITGKESFTESGAKQILSPILQSYNIRRFCDFSNNPNIEDLQKGMECYHTHQAELIIAIGGGSVLDMAKLINVFANNKEKIDEYLLKNMTLQSKALPLIAIPTTAGSGSEATDFAVLYVNKKKYSVEHSSLLPDVTIIDPSFTIALPSHLTAISGIDALSQAIESYWSINSNLESKKYSGIAINLIMNNLSRAVRGHSDVSRLAMSKAAHLAGKAINITKTTAPHALSYSLTSWFSIPHGQAVALTLPHFLVFNYLVNEADVIDRRGADYVKKTIKEIIAFLGCIDVIQAREKIQNFMKQIGLATSFLELKVDKCKAIETIINNVNDERLTNNPREIRREQLKDILNLL